MVRTRLPGVVLAFTETGDGFHTPLLRARTLESAEERKQRVFTGAPEPDTVIRQPRPVTRE